MSKESLEKLRILSNKSTIIAVIMLLTIAATLMTCLPIGNAASNEQTWTFLSVNPNPIGVGQIVTVSMWIYPLPPNANLRYDNLTVTMTKPDGTTQTFGPATGGPLGNSIWTFTTATTGTYKFVAHFPGKTFLAVPPPYVPPGDVVRQASNSREVLLTVQQQPIEPLPQTPLPTEYWTYPINAQNQLWASISGSWLQSGMFGYNNTGPFSPYSTGPKTAHVIWKKQYAFGGIEGDGFEANSYAGGTQYEDKYSPSIIINGRFYQYSSVGSLGWGDRRIGNALDCIDLATGQVLWTKNISASFGQIYEYNSANQVGLHAYLWNQGFNTWKMYDAYNGNWIMDIVNVDTKGATTALAFDNVGSCGGTTGRGAILYYMINPSKGWLALWNQTKFFDSTGTGDGVITYQSPAEKQQYGVYGGQFRPRTTAANDFARGIQWNVTIPKEPISPMTFRLSAPFGVGVLDTSLMSTNFVSVYGYNLAKGQVQKLYGPVNFTGAVQTNFPVGSGLFGRFDQAQMRYLFWDLTTGQYVGNTDPMTFPWGSLSATCLFAYDRFYVDAYDGTHCYDLETRKELWHFSPGNSGLETPFGTWVMRLLTMRIAGDKIYTGTGVWHNFETYSRGDKLYCLDASTGKMLWNYSGYWNLGAVANGYLVGLNQYDQNFYCFSKGPSATTVSAPNTAVTDGTAVLIQGAVTDQSPGAKGTPAIADKDMNAWMEYLYQQQPKPLGATGVPVYLQAYRVDDGSMIDVGSVYSDINGHYEYLWTPPDTGTYKILASFPGSDAYWQSSAETALGVTAAPPAAEPVEIPAYPDYTPTIIGTGIAIIAAVAIVGILILRKRP